MKEWNELLEERATRMDKPLKPQVVTHTLNKFLADDAIIACDCGTVTTWAARYIKIRDEMMFSASGLLATMGNGLPYAVGAAVAYPGPAGGLPRRRRRLHHDAWARWPRW